jgi:2-C-methyl-D-erythritol 4-phosphate cytidylyltransferase
VSAAKTAAVVVAGGSGERFGRTGGKQLASVAGWPVVSWALRALDAAGEVDLIVIVRPADRAREYAEQAVEPLGLTTQYVYADSGGTRQHSVAAGLAVLPEGIDTVVVHDGARPLITPDVVAGAVHALADSSSDGVVVGHPSIDTLKVVDGTRIVDTPDRCRYWQVQTPQVFRRDALERAHRKAHADGFSGTDDASLVERVGGVVDVIEGPRDNIKVTVPEDLAYVRAALNHRREGDDRCG